MPSSPDCARCGSTCHDLHAPLGLCPGCWLEAGIESRSKSPRRPAPRAVAPAVIGRHFPAYQILGIEGQGGMGTVYRARQKKLDRPVAIKVLHPEFACDVDFTERFAREARTLAKLQHPGIVGIHDFGESHKIFYLVLEYVSGANLRLLIERGELKPKESLEIARQVCRALDYAHARGVVHRDIKPENILVDDTGRVRLADFGLAKLIGSGGRPASLTEMQEVLGTVNYVAPEQWDSPRTVDGRADLYSLGVVLYEMLTGHVPLGRFDPPSSRARIARRTDEAILRALSRDPRRRFRTAAAFADELCAEEATKKRPVGVARRAPRVAAPQAPSPPPSPEPTPAARTTHDAWRQVTGPVSRGMMFWGAVVLVSAFLPWVTMGEASPLGPHLLEGWGLAPGTAMQLDASAFKTSVDILGFGVPNIALAGVFLALVFLAHGRARGKPIHSGWPGGLIVYGLVHATCFVVLVLGSGASLGLGFVLTAVAFLAAGAHFRHDRARGAAGESVERPGARTPTPQELM